ncbi:UNVERIFIED_CONTAM: hypothetical protein Slati_0870300 [Sesamum latifolium]|uniref:Uncharacterized protein n=1 Tax=Sesamum latifolium TaxID=2727402 RepID=A0AAW2XRD1_9LAMI
MISAPGLKHILACGGQRNSFSNQAIAILWLAKRVTDEKRNVLESNGSPSLQQLQIHGSRGLSLKKSLQKFLRKRRDRIQASMPY